MKSVLRILVTFGYLATFFACTLGVAGVFLVIAFGILLDLILGSLACDLDRRLRRPR